jgi:VWFA-related protein
MAKTAPRYVIALAIVVLLGAALAVVGYGQTQFSAPAPKAPIHVVTNEVEVPVTVTDRRGDLVLDLSRHDFHVFDDGVEQKIDHWELGGNPLAVALVIDTSSRLHPMASDVHSMGIIFVDTVMALDGEAAVLTYDSFVNVRQGFTVNHDSVEKAIEATRFDGDESDLYDGMAAACGVLAAQPPKWHRIMLVVGESQDSRSTARLEQVVRDAERANISIYIVGISSAGADLKSLKINPPPLHFHGVSIGAAGCSDAFSRYGDSQCFNLATPSLWLLERGINEIKHHQLEVAAAATGGIDYSGFRISVLQSALDKIGSELHAQYILDYRPKSDNAPGFHVLRVTVARQDVIVRARPGYYFTKP